MSTSGLRAFGSLFASFPFVIKTSMPHLALSVYDYHAVSGG